MLPILEKNTQDGAFALPEKIEGVTIVDEFFNDLDLDDIETLAAIAILKRACTEENIEKISMVPTDQILPKLHQRGLVKEISPNQWILTASIFEEILALSPTHANLHSRPSLHVS